MLRECEISSSTAILDQKQTRDTLGSPTVDLKGGDSSIIPPRSGIYWALSAERLSIGRGSMTRVLEHSPLQEVSVVVRFPDFGTEDKNVRKMSGSVVGPISSR